MIAMYRNISIVFQFESPFYINRCRSPDWNSAPTLTLQRNVSMNIYYVYQHRRDDTGEVFYVGKGKGNRCFSKNRNKHWKNISNKTSYSIEIVYDNLPSEIACLVEIGLITKYKIQGLELCNYTIGGEGTIGYKHSFSSKEIMSKNKKGRKLSPEHKKKISESRKGFRMSDEQKQKLSNTLTGKKLSEYHKNRIKEGMNIS